MSFSGFSSGPLFRKREPKFKADSGFMDHLSYFFDRDTADQVVKALKTLGLPVPKKAGCLFGDKGIMIFANPYGVVVRIEEHSIFDERINDNPWVIKPLGTIKAGNAVVEVCPGTHAANDEDHMRVLDNRLYQTGIDYHDDQIANTGLLPIKNLQFPQGVPVVIDRGAVEKLYRQTKTVAQSLAEAGFDADPQDALYDGLQRAFTKAWPQDGGKVKAKNVDKFWKACKQARKEGALVSGWNTAKKKERKGSFYKRGAAMRCAAVYEKKLQKAMKP